MNNFITKREILPKHIEELNLVTEGDSDNSGSRDNIRYGSQVLKDGFTVYDGNKLIAWAAVFKYEYVDSTETHFCVKKEYRRKGIGKSLYKQCMEAYPYTRVMPWDARSYAFFGNVKQ